MSAAIKSLYGTQRTLIVDHSFGGGYYCILKEEKKISVDVLDQIYNKMYQLQLEARKIKIRAAKPEDWRHLLAPRVRTSRPPVLMLANHISASYEFTNLDLSAIPHYELRPYDRGFLLRIGENGDELNEYTDSPKLFGMMKEHERWGRILKVSSIYDLNKQIMEKGFKQLIWVAEGLHEKRIAALADDISSQKGTRVIFVAGPSSSGKTTFTKRLAIHLAVNGIQSKYLSMDNYFLDRDKITPQADGTLDFENVNCIDLDTLKRELMQLVNGQSVFKRSYNFVDGKQEILKDKMSLKRNEVLIFEGIHGLNPRIHEGMIAKSYYRVYISALTQLNIDNTHPVSTSDGRLIRRIVRDHQYRGYSADDTINRWNSVRHGELRNIFPFQEHADMMFNSALIYEFAILKRYALPLLKAASKNTIRDRLITLMSLFHTIPDRHVPGTSILREFIGNSYFKY
ncbi:MAG: nucleoside kinase [Candidatus Marinimicrobia bacterium]|jgi:uridine kinase|nr:nucleoside kinase [Candidatus Neomarinimicrobiota bacterium]MBT3630574.1 nucleoside kinase [Candidatus Neomarinimicrobiota bacterium]MBT3823357.1 nucleoside kinase [Candidatus Neomarinimicrobiota bacterium]MBT4295861.1 nucleoside kinase [Candidatus Neomarinimicrobiota bacterium]MBT4992333.1 nucleoside kinase [Candidatus Neomarinimicrobiota bacterium]